MPRPPRIYIEKALYYVTCKGDYHQPIFIDGEDYRVFIEALKKYKEQYKFKLYAYCLVTEHFHLLLELPMQSEQPYKAGVLSSIMHDLNSYYTKYYNGKYARKGHLFRERYKAALIEKEPYLLKLTAYIHLNPKRLNHTIDPAQYPYSSYAAYLNKELPPQGLLKEEREEILALLNGRSYEDFIQYTAKEPDFSRMHEYLQKGILGAREFQDKAKKAFSGSKNVYRKERTAAGFGLGQKLGIISFIAIFAGLSIAYILKFSVPKKEKPAASFSLTYKIPAQIKELLRDLENTEWQIRVISLSEGKVYNDMVYFEDGKFVSQNYSLRGYPASDYSLIIEEEDKVIWETAQPGPQGDISWRGEIKKGEMEGNFRLRTSAGEVKDFSFVSINSRVRK